MADSSHLYCQGRSQLGVHEAKVDIDNAVFVSKQLLLKLGLFNLEWVMVSTLGCPSEKTSSRLSYPGPVEDQMLVRDPKRAHLSVVCVSEFGKHLELDLQDSVGFITPTHWFNLSNGDPIPIGCKTVKIKVNIFALDLQLNYFKND